MYILCFNAVEICHVLYFDLNIFTNSCTEFSKKALGIGWHDTYDINVVIQK